MIEKLYNWAISLPKKIFTRDEIKDEVNHIADNIVYDLLPMLTVCKEVTDDTTRTKDVEALDGTNLSKDFPVVKDLLRKIEYILGDIYDNKDTLLDYVKNMPNKMTTKGITTNQSLALNTLAKIRFILDMSADLMLLVVEHECNSDERAYSKKITKIKKTLLYDYSVIIKNYTTLKEVLVDLNDIVIANNEIDKSILLQSKSNLVNNKQLENGFIGLPYLWVRVWMTNRDRKEIQLLKAKKEYVEGLILEMELKQKDQYDSKVEESLELSRELINEYEEKIEDLSK